MGAAEDILVVMDRNDFPWLYQRQNLGYALGIYAIFHIHDFEGVTI
jgi:hypothetical protein